MQFKPLSMKERLLLVGEEEGEEHEEEKKEPEEEEAEINEAKDEKYSREEA